MALATRSCPRCQGDLYIEDDLFSRDVVCLQCGARKSLPRRRTSHSAVRRAA